MNTNFKVIGLTRLRIKPESTAPGAGSLESWPSELLIAALKLPVIFFQLGLRAQFSAEHESRRQAPQTCETHQLD